MKHNMKRVPMNFIFGTAGFAKEVDWLAEDIYNFGGTDYRPHFFVVEDDNELIGKSINSKPIISESDFALKYGDDINNCFIAVGNPQIKEKIYSNIKSVAPKSRFPSLVHPDVSFDKRDNKVIIGEGSIICSRCVLTTDVVVGKFIHLNLGCTVGHDSSIGDFSTISPGVHISGNVNISEKVFIGTGSVIIERLDICSDIVIGASSTVSKNLELPGTYVGLPARKIR